MSILKLLAALFLFSAPSLVLYANNLELCPCLKFFLIPHEPIIHFYTLFNLIFLKALNVTHSTKTPISIEMEKFMKFCRVKISLK